MVPLNYVARSGRISGGSLFFDREKSQVSVVCRGRQGEFPVPGAQVMADMKGGESEPWDYQIVSRGKLKDHCYEVVVRKKPIRFSVDCEP